MAPPAGALPDWEPEDSHSQPPSPRTTRRPLLRRHHSGSEPDERSPLLTVSTRSRVRIHSGANSPRLPHLSRNQSYIGKLAPYLLVRPSEANLGSGFRQRSRRAKSQPTWLVELEAHDRTLRTAWIHNRFQAFPRRASLVRPIHQHRLGARYHCRLPPRQGVAQQTRSLGSRPCSLRRRTGLDSQCPFGIHRRTHCVLRRRGRNHRLRLQGWLLHEGMVSRRRGEHIPAVLHK